MQLNTHSRRKMPFANSLISAGSAYEIGDDYQLIDLNELVTNGREGFLIFEVTGDSMVDEIRPGNVIFVDSWAEPRSGNIIAASVNGLTSVKIFQKKTNGLFLVSANKSYPPREIKPQDTFRILGVVRGHMELYR